MKTFEVELRGPLTPTTKKKLLKFLDSHGKKVKEYKRTQWIFGLSHQKKIDFRIKQTNGECEFSLKAGKLSDTNRHEISIPFVKDRLQQALDLAKYLGRNEGLIAKRNASIYSYKGIEWAVVDVPGHSSYFEAEKLVKNKDAAGKAEKEIRRVAEELGLNIFADKELMGYIRKLDKEANKKFKL